jgi:branched-chain amino acid transport system permease protein
MIPFANVIFNGLAYGMLLFLIAGGLSITMGLMGFANMAHISFAMLGGYVAAQLMLKAGWPFLATLPAAFVAVAIASVIVERLIFRYFYRAGELDQVLLTIGLIYISIAGATYFWGAAPQSIVMPSYLSGEIAVGPLSFSLYRLFILGMGAAITVILVVTIEWTSLGAHIRAAVDNRRMTASCGVNVDLLFTGAFAAGGGLAGLGGALSMNLLGLDPYFPFRYLVYVLIVVAIGGSRSIKGSVIAAVVLGLCDAAGKYYVPTTGAFIIYALMVAILLWRPNGLYGRR